MSDGELVHVLVLISSNPRWEGEGVTWGCTEHCFAASVDPLKADTFGTVIRDNKIL